MASFTPTYDWQPGNVGAQVAYYIHLFQQCRIRRSGGFDGQWEEAAALCWPEYRNTFSQGHLNAPGLKRTQYQLDSAAAIASHRFMAIVNYVMTPHDRMWSVLVPSDENLLKDKDTKAWFTNQTRKLWKARYDPMANFSGQNMQNLQGLGVFGNHGMLIQERAGKQGGLAYRSCSVGEIYILQNFQGIVTGYIRIFKLDAQQAYGQFGESIPPVLRAALEQNSKTLYNFIQVVHPRTDWMPWEILSPRGKEYLSAYISVEGYCMLEAESGYRCKPLAYGRYMQAPEEEYGRGPAQMTLPALKTRNAMKGDLLKTSHDIGNPELFIGDDGMLDPQFQNGAINYGGFSPEGKFLVAKAPHGELPAIETAMASEQQFVDDAFLVSLYADLFDEAKAGGAQRSAREVLERIMNRGIFLSPLGRQYTEYTGPMIDREMDILSSQGKIDPMTPAMKEAGGEYDIKYRSILGRAAQSDEAAATAQFLEFVEQMAQSTGDPSVMDAIEINEALGVIADAGGVPDKVLASMESRQKKQKARAAAQERDQQVKELPGRAAMAKAQAIQAKAQTGGNIGGTLSGTPQGGMPMMPGQSQPGGRRFGQPG